MSEQKPNHWQTYGSSFILVATVFIVCLFSFDAMKYFLFVSMFGNWPNQAPSLFSILLPLATVVAAIIAGMAYLKQAKAQTTQAEALKEQAIIANKTLAFQSRDALDKQLKNATALLNSKSKPMEIRTALQNIEKIVQVDARSYYSQCITYLCHFGNELSQLNTITNKNNEDSAKKAIDNGYIIDDVVINESIFEALVTISNISIIADNTPDYYRPKIGISGFVVHRNPNKNEWSLNTGFFEGMQFYRCNLDGIRFLNCNFFDSGFSNCKNIKLNYCLISNNLYSDGDVFSDEAVFIPFKKQFYYSKRPVMTYMFYWDNITTANRIYMRQLSKPTWQKQMSNYCKNGSIGALSPKHIEKWLKSPAPRMEHLSQYMASDD